MSYAVHIKQVPAQHVVTKRAHTTLEKIGDAMAETLAAVATSVTPKDAAQGAPFAIYHNEPFRPDDIDVELGMPVHPEAEIADGASMTVKDLPAGPVAYTTHVGSYGSIGGAYSALYEWLATHGLRSSGPPREIYLVGPGQGTSPSEYRTELDVPIANAEV